MQSSLKEMILDLDGPKSDDWYFYNKGRETERHTQNKKTLSEDEAEIGVIQLYKLKNTNN